MKKVLALIFALVILNANTLYAGYNFTYPLKGTIKGVYVTYKDEDEITLKTGYGECNGNYFEITSDTDHTMTSLASAEDFHYIYVDDSASSYPIPTVIDSVDEPSWSDSQQGWYYGNDRCIGVVYSASGISTIANFNNINDEIVLVEMNIDLTGDMNPSGAWQIPTLSESDAKTPVNCVAVYVYMNNYQGLGNRVLIAATSKENADKGTLWYEGDGFAMRSDLFASAKHWVPLGSSRKIRIMGDNDDANTMRLEICGFKITR